MSTGSRSGGASAVKKPGHFEVRKCSSQMVTFLFSVHTITEAKQYARLGRAEPGIEPGRWIFQPCHLTWRALV